MHTAISEVFSQQIGTVRSGLRSVVLPQLFGFILLVLFVSFSGLDPEPYFRRYLLLVGYVTLFGGLILVSCSQFQFGMYVGELLGGIVLLVLFEQRFPTQLEPSVVGPLLVFALGAHFLSLRAFQRIVVVLTLIVGGVGAVVVFGLPQSNLGVGLLAAVVVVGITLLLRRSDLPAPAPRVPDALKTMAIDTSRLSAETRSSEEAIGEYDRESANLVRVAHRVFRKELASESSWRLTISSLLIASTVFSIPFLSQQKELGFAVSWLLLAFGQVLTQHAMLRADSLAGVFRYSVLSLSLLFGWWALLAVFDLSQGNFFEFGFGLLLLLAGCIPLSGKLAGVFFLSLLSIGIGVASLSSTPLLFVSYYVIVLLIAVRNSLASYLHLATRGSSLVVSRVIESASVQGVLSLLAWSMRQIVSAPQVVVISAGEGVDRHHEGGREQVAVDPVHLKAFLSEIKDTGGEGGVLDHEFLQSKFDPLLESLFGDRPRRLFFLRFKTAAGDGEEFIHMLAPVTLWARLSNVEKLFRGLYTIASIVKLSFSASRRRSRTADYFLAAQKTASERENEFNQVVHRVNNIAQDMTVYCDTIRREVEEFPDSSNTEKVREELSKMGLALRVLFAGVSDVKLLKELVHLKRFERKEQIPLRAIEEEIRPYLEYLSRRSRQTFSIGSGFAGEVGYVEVVSREFLEACLRLAVLVRRRHLAETGSIEIRAEASDDCIDFVYCDDGTDWSAEERQLIANEKASATEGEESQYLQAIRNFARLSAGSVTLAPESGAVPGAEVREMFRLSLRKVERRSTQTVLAGGYILLVDDSHEVTTFYSRIAEAMQLHYFTADSVGAAKELIAEHGKPRLIVSDIQLLDGSGLDLVRYARTEFGGELPIIVVSGNTEGEVSQEAREAGATRFLTKPVGRRKLFGAIQELLSESSAAG